MSAWPRGQELRLPRGRYRVQTPPVTTFFVDRCVSINSYSDERYEPFNHFYISGWIRAVSRLNLVLPHKFTSLSRAVARIRTIVFGHTQQRTLPGSYKDRQMPASSPKVRVYHTVCMTNARSPDPSLHVHYLSNFPCFQCALLGLTEGESMNL